MKYKYRINELLAKMPHEDRLKAIKELNVGLGWQFKRDRYIRVGSNLSISIENALHYCSVLAIEPEALISEHAPTRVQISKLFAPKTKHDARTKK